MEQKEIKVMFAPGCFDDFEGSQEELDSLINEIKEMASNGKLQEMARPLDEERLAEILEDFDEEDFDITATVEGINKVAPQTRTLH